MTYTGPYAGDPFTAEDARDMVGVWQDYTPTWAASTAPVLGDGILTGRWVQLGSTVHATVYFEAGSTTTFGSGVLRWGVPVPAAATHDFVGDVFIGDSSVGSAGFSTGICYLSAGSNSVSIYAGNVGATESADATSPQVWAVGDRLWLGVTYETAT